jgi:SAM-dependent methyltransferase
MMADMPDRFASAAAYDRFMGRFSRPLAARFADLVDAPDGADVLDVGSGPGALTTALADRGYAVRAVDPSPAFVVAVRSAVPGLEARVASADHLPFADSTFDATVAQLVVHFMSDPVAGLVEMARVTRPGGVVAACVWDFAGDRGPLGVFDRAVHDLDPEAPTERHVPGAAAGELARIFTAAGLVDVGSGELDVTVELPSFDAWWEPFTLGAGLAGAYVASLAPDARRRLRAHAADLVPDAPFTITATAWTAIGRPPG